jgi:hypothetical protein
MALKKNLKFAPMGFAPRMNGIDSPTRGEICSGVIAYALAWTHVIMEGQHG